MVTQRHRLGGLQMGEARHQVARVLFSPVQQGGLQGLQLGDGAIAGVAHPEAEIQRHLIVAAARRVQTARGFADQFIQSSLHIHVDVLELVAEGECPVHDLGFDGVQAAQDGVSVSLLNDPLLGQHPAMGARSGQILTPQTLIHADGDVDRLHDLGRARRKASAPHVLTRRLHRRSRTGG